MGIENVDNGDSSTWSSINSNTKYNFLVKFHTIRIKQGPQQRSHKVIGWRGCLTASVSMKWEKEAEKD